MHHGLYNFWIESVTIIKGHRATSRSPSPRRSKSKTPIKSLRTSPRESDNSEKSFDSHTNRTSSRISPRGSPRTRSPIKSPKNNQRVRFDSARSFNSAKSFNSIQSSNTDSGFHKEVTTFKHLTDALPFLVGPPVTDLYRYKNGCTAVWVLYLGTEWVL